MTACLGTCMQWPPSRVSGAINYETAQVIGTVSWYTVTVRYETTKRIRCLVSLTSRKQAASLGISSGKGLVRIEVHSCRLDPNLCNPNGPLHEFL